MLLYLLSVCEICRLLYRKRRMRATAENSPDGILQFFRHSCGRKAHQRAKGKPRKFYRRTSCFQSGALIYYALFFDPWGSSSVGRASRSQRGGREFESPLLHHPAKNKECGFHPIKGVPRFCFSSDMRQTSSMRYTSETMPSRRQAFAQNIFLRSSGCGRNLRTQSAINVSSRQK